MKLLAIDTSATALSAAIVNEKGLLGEFALNTGKNHSLGLLPLLESLLHNAGLSLQDMDAFAVTIGPGSFTGLRIGLATAKAWGDATGKPLIGISSTDALARAAGQEGYVCPLLDARRDQVYTALYRGGERLWPDLAIAPLELAERLAELAEPVYCLGDGLAPYEEELRQRLGQQLRPVQKERQLVMASAAAMLGLEKYQRGEISAPETLLPVYLRLSEAEEKRLAAQAAAAAADKVAAAEKIAPAEKTAEAEKTAAPQGAAPAPAETGDVCPDTAAPRED